MKKKSRRILPFTFADGVTLLNLVAGIFAIYAAIQGEALISGLLIIFGLLFDFLDGRIARALKQESALGRELDSFADMVTFGVAPGVLLLTLHPETRLLLLPFVFYAVAGAYRLARFNLLKSDKKTKKGFEGLPIPAAATILLITIPFSLPLLLESIILILLAGAMVSKFHVKKF